MAGNGDVGMGRVLPGEEADYVQAWRRWHGELRSNGFTGTICWNPIPEQHGMALWDVRTAYPGDAFVDQIGLDVSTATTAAGCRAAGAAHCRREGRQAQLLAHAPHRPQLLARIRGVAWQEPGVARVGLWLWREGCPCCMAAATTQVHPADA